MPKPTNLADFVKDEDQAIILGKALFWDTQVGSDGKTACATCHFHTEADGRTRNQHGLSPEAGTLGYVLGPVNQKAKLADFPFHKLSNPFDESSRNGDSDFRIFGSQGVRQETFIKIRKFGRKDSKYSANPSPIKSSG